MRHLHNEAVLCIALCLSVRLSVSSKFITLRNAYAFVIQLQKNTNLLTVGEEIGFHVNVKDRY